MERDQLKPGVIVRRPIVPEPVQVLAAGPVGGVVVLNGKGLNASQVRELVLNRDHLASATFAADSEPIDRDLRQFQLELNASAARRDRRGCAMRLCSGLKRSAHGVLEVAVVREPAGRRAAIFVQSISGET